MQYVIEHKNGRGRVVEVKTADRKDDAAVHMAVRAQAKKVEDRGHVFVVYTKRGHRHVVTFQTKGKGDYTFTRDEVEAAKAKVTSSVPKPRKSSKKATASK